MQKCIRGGGAGRYAGHLISSGLFDDQHLVNSHLNCCLVDDRLLLLRDLRYGMHNHWLAAADLGRGVRSLSYVAQCRYKSELEAKKRGEHSCGSQSVVRGRAGIALWSYDNK